MGIQDLAVIKVDRLEHRAAESLHNRSADLILQPLGIYHRAAIKGLNHANDSYFIAINGHFRASCNVTAFFESPREAETACRGTLRFSPAKLVRSSFVHGAKAVVLQILHAKF